MMIMMTMIMIMMIMMIMMIIVMIMMPPAMDDDRTGAASVRLVHLPDQDNPVLSSLILSDQDNPVLSIFSYLIKR